MPVNEQPDRVLAELSDRQDGVFTRAQAKRSGLSAKQIRHRCAIGLWIDVFPNVFRFRATPMNKRLERRAALEFGGREALLATRSAGELCTSIASSRHSQNCLFPIAGIPSIPG